MKIPNLLLPRYIAPVPKPPTWLRGDWRFGIGVGTELPDLSKYRAHGTISGADWATGLHGKCLEFVPTVPDYVSIAAAYTQLDFTSEAFSIIARIYIDDLTGARNVFCRGRDSRDGYFCWVGTDGRTTFFTSQSGADQTSQGSAAGIATGSWYTVGITRDGASVTIYKNGVDDTDVVGTHINPATSARVAKIGIYDNLSDNPFDGKIEFLRIFSRALPASEHLAYHNALA